MLNRQRKGMISSAEERERGEGHQEGKDLLIGLRGGCIGCDAAKGGPLHLDADALDGVDDEAGLPGHLDPPQPVLAVLPVG